jgi:hypothetical protein
VLIFEQILDRSPSYTMLLKLRYVVTALEGFKVSVKHGARVKLGTRGYLDS